MNNINLSMALVFEPRKAFQEMDARPRIWSGRSWLFSSVYALLPVVLIFGGWAVFALGRA
jgi:hypothetical protein